MTAGRAEIARKAAAFTVRRERRDIPVLEIGPFEEAIWDGRYRVVNGRAVPLAVRGGGRYGVSPHLERKDGDFGPEEQAAGGFSLRPICGRAGRLIPVFELPVANALARLCGRPHFPDCPWPARPAGQDL